MNPPSSSATADHADWWEDATYARFAGDNDVMLGVNVHTFKDTGWAKMMQASSDDGVVFGLGDDDCLLLSDLAPEAFVKAADSVGDDVWKRATKNEPDALKQLQSTFATQMYELAGRTNSVIAPKPRQLQRVRVSHRHLC